MAFSSTERVHGGIDREELCALGVSVPVIDFSVNLNPYGPCQPVVQATRDTPLDAYPDPLARGARRAWAEALETSIDRIAVGHGAADLFWALSRALLSPGSRVVIAEPTFSEFRVAAQSVGATIEQVWAREENDFRFDLALLAQRCRGAQVLYLCAPNNPTGQHVAAEEIARLSRSIPDTNIVLDQSFLSLSDHAAELRFQLPDNVVCVRSLTKDFALAGLRIGILNAARALVTHVERMRPTWSTSAPAQAAIEAAAAEHAFVIESFHRMRRDRDGVRQVLRAHGLVPLASSSVYQLVRVGDAAAFRERLLLQGIAVRDCSSFGLPDHVRVAARPEPDVRALAAALACL